MKKLRLSTLYCQQSEPWGSKQLGNNPSGSKYTIKNYGCLLVTVDVYLNALGININPLDLNEKGKQNGLFGDPKQQTGLYVFDALKNIYPDITAYYISPKWTGPVSDAGIKKMYDLIDEGKYLIAEVDFYPNTVDEDQHWVGIYGYDDNGEFLIFDPWTGTLVPLSVYGDPKRVLYCYRAYSKPLAFDSTEPMVCHPASVNTELIRKSSGFDETIKACEINKDPKDVSVDTVKNTIEGYRSRITRLQGELSAATEEVSNREEQVARLKQQAEETANLNKEQYDALSQQLEIEKKSKESLSTTISEKQTTINELSAEKGQLNIQIAQLKAQLNTKFVVIYRFGEYFIARGTK